MRKVISTTCESSSGAYGVRYRVFSRDRLVAKEKFFDTKKKLDKFVEKIQDGDNFHDILAYSYPGNTDTDM